MSCLFKGLNDLPSAFMYWPLSLEKSRFFFCRSNGFFSAAPLCFLDDDHGQTSKSSVFCSLPCSLPIETMAPLSCFRSTFSSSSFSVYSKSTTLITNRLSIYPQRTNLEQSMVSNYWRYQCCLILRHPNLSTTYPS